MQDTPSPSFSISNLQMGSGLTQEDTATKERCACSTNSTLLCVASPTVGDTMCSQTEGESSKWPTPGCNDSAFQALPTELLVEICKHLGWEDVFAIRRTSKFFFDVSNSRPLWVCLFYRLSNEVRVPPILERPISAYTVKELEYLVMRRISSEIRWATGVPPRIQAFPAPDLSFEDDDIQLLDGGRWLLTCTQREYGRVYCYDLDDPLSKERRCIIDLELDGHEKSPWLMITSLDKKARPELAFNLCLIPRSTIPPAGSPTNWAPEQTHFYRLTVKGRGTDAILEAHKFKSLPNDVQANTDEADFYGDYVVKCLDNVHQSFYLFEVCNWVLSDSTTCFKAYIEDYNNNSEFLDDALLLPRDRLLLVSNSDISLYDISNLPRLSETGQISTLEPYWTLAKTSLDRQLEVGYFKPYLDSQASRAAFILDDVVYGMTIPHDSRSNAYLQVISDADFSNLTLACAGIGKMYAYESDEDGAFTTMDLLWPDDKDETQDGSSLLPAFTRPTLHRHQSPYQWEEDPILDESSNRILSFAHKLWVVMDFAYK